MKMEDELGGCGPSLTGRGGTYVGGVGMPVGGAQPSTASSMPQERRQECHCVEELWNPG